MIKEIVLMTRTRFFLTFFHQNDFLQFLFLNELKLNLNCSYM